MLVLADMQPNVLILGGTTEARELAAALSGRPFTTTVSLAGRTAAPAPQAAPVRVGGFGGVEGLAEYLRANNVDFLIDATHPYAQTISATPATPAAKTSTPLRGLRRPPWQAVAGDFWVEVAGPEGAVRALG